MKLKHTLLAIGLQLLTCSLYAQIPAGYKSTHQREWEEHKAAGFSDAYYEQMNLANIHIVAPSSRATCNLNKKVYGWHPYWDNGLEGNYQWANLSHLCYFSYEVTASTGAAASTHSFSSTLNVVSQALSHGVKVHLCATLFSNHSAFLGSTTAQTTFINNIKNLLQSSGGTGVNLDFEGMASSNKAAFTAFVTSLSNSLKAANPNYEVTIALPSVDWSPGTFDIAALTPYVDLFIIMGYDYYYGGSTTAGPTSPTYTYQTSYDYNVSKSVTTYLAAGVPPAKLLLGLPYYGTSYQVTSTTLPAAVSSGTSGSSVLFKTVKTNANGYFNTRKWEPNCLSPYYNYNSGVQRQLFMDDAYSFGKKLDIVNIRGIGGIGIWALSYDDGYTDWWDKIRDNLSSCAVVACSDTIYDDGGPGHNYYDKVKSTYTISPTGASSVSLHFTSFATEANYDSLFLYDGATINSPIIGKYTGTNSPGTVNSTGPSLTMRFKADNATNAAGFTAIWNCVVGATAPVCNFSASSTSVMAGSAVNFTDLSTGAPTAWAWTFQGATIASSALQNPSGIVFNTVGTDTVKFTATNSHGSCSSYKVITVTAATTADVTPPTTLISAPASWETSSFTTNFTDADNSGGSGVEKSFYQVIDYDGTEWRANNIRGFFNDNFDGPAIHPEWKVVNGNWSINTGGYLEQSDATINNTNMYAPLTQNLSNRYLYHWSGMLGGAGTNRRAGLHFFCDSPDSVQRGNSYFVWFRLDNDKIQIYRTTNNNAGNPTVDTTYNFNVNTWYDFKVMYDRTTGVIKVFVNNVMSATWKDPNPLSNGSYISLRSGNADYQVNDFKVYRSRAASAVVNVNTGANSDIRYQNPYPSASAGRIKSVVVDSANNVSTVASQDVDVDWTNPSDAVSINDGTATDIDTTYSTTQLSANWAICTDANSGIQNYWYAIGTTAGDSNVVAWTNNALNDSITQTGLTLSVGQKYYFAVKAENYAGLKSNVQSSNGQIVVAVPNGISSHASNITSHIAVYPNPFEDKLSIDIASNETSVVDIKLVDVLGREVMSLNNQRIEKGINKITLNTADINLKTGVYYLNIKGNSAKLNFSAPLYKLTVGN